MAVLMTGRCLIGILGRRFFVRINLLIPIQSLSNGSNPKLAYMFTLLALSLCLSGSFPLTVYLQQGLPWLHGRMMHVVVVRCVCCLSPGRVWGMYSIWAGNFNGSPNNPLSRSFFRFGLGSLEILGDTLPRGGCHRAVALAYTV